MFLFFLMMALLNTSHLCADDIRSAISYRLNGGRFGDNLKSFTQSYWLAYIHNLPFFYVPFPHADKLQMSVLLPHATREAFSVYKKTVIFERNHSVSINPLDGTLYILNFYSNTGIDWDNTAFVQELKRLIIPLSPLDLPADIGTSVAIHVRRGGGFGQDNDRTKRHRPAHFPHISYYAKALDYILNRVEEINTVYLFTDDRDPQKVVQELIEHMKPDNRSRVVMQFRTTSNTHDAHVLEDFFALQEARYLIRPQSNFSLYAQKLGNHAITIFPAQARSGRPWGAVTVMAVLSEGKREDISI